MGAAGFYKGEAVDIPQYTQDNSHDKKLAKTANGAKVRKLASPRSGKSPCKGSVAEACLASIELLGTHMAGGRGQEPR